MCLSAPAPAALCLPDRAVCSNHMQPLWDLPSPAWMCQLGSAPRLSLQPICNWCQHLSVAPVAFLKPLIWRESVTQHPAGLQKEKAKKRLNAVNADCISSLLKSSSQPQIVIEWCLRPLLPPFACCFWMQHENLLQTLQLAFKAGVCHPQGWGQPL